MGTFSLRVSLLSWSIIHSFCRYLLWEALYFWSHFAEKKTGWKWIFVYGLLLLDTMQSPEELNELGFIFVGRQFSLGRLCFWSSCEQSTGALHFRLSRMFVWHVWKIAIIFPEQKAGMFTAFKWACLTSGFLSSTSARAGIHLGPSFQRPWDLGAGGLLQICWCSCYLLCCDYNKVLSFWPTREFCDFPQHPWNCGRLTC